MGKLAVVFFAALAVHAVFGGHPVNYGYGQEELKDLVRQVGKVSDNIYETFQTSPLRRGFSWEAREFGQEIEEIINYWEELTSKHDVDTDSEVYTILRELREVRSYLNQLRSTNDDTIMRKLELDLGVTIKKVAKHMISWVKTVEEESLGRNSLNLFTRHSQALTSASLYADIKTVVGRFVFALQKLYEHVSTYQVHGLYSNSNSGDSYTASGKDIHQALKHLESTFERVTFDSKDSKVALLHLVQEYVDNLRPYTGPEYHQYYERFVRPESQTYSSQEIITNLFAFIRTYVSNIEKMPQTATVAYLKATDRLYSRLNIMQEVNTPVRHLVFRVHTTADLLTAGYETMSSKSSMVRESFTEQARHFAKNLEQFVSSIKGGKVHDELLTNWKSIISRLENNWTQHALTVSVQEATTVFHQWLMLYPNNEELVLEVGTKFHELLQKQTKVFIELCETIDDVDIWTTFLLALTNKLSVYFHDEVVPEDMEILMGAIKSIVKLLDNEVHTEFKELSFNLKKIVEEFQTEPVLVNTFLQRISLELSQWAWSIYKRTGAFPAEVRKVLKVYVPTLERIHSNNRPVRGLLYSLPPSEVTLEIQKVANRFTDTIGIIVPGFKHHSLYYRGHYFQQILDVAMFRLRQIAHHQDSNSINEVYGNLRTIYSNLESDLKQHDVYFKVKLGIYVQDTVAQLKNLAFEGHHLEKHPGFVRLYADFLYGMKQLITDVQADLQMVFAQYSVRTINMQIVSVADHLSALLRRTQLKPELRRVLLTQVRALAYLVEWLIKDFQSIPGNMGFSAKYSKIYEQLLHVIKTGGDKSVEELSVFLDAQIKEIVYDMERLTQIGHESSELYLVYRYTLETLSNIMVRLENVHYYEYYQYVVNHQDVLGFIHKFSAAITDKFQRTPVNFKAIEYNLVIQVWRYIYQLHLVAMRFQVEADVFPKGLYGTMAGLIQGVRESTTIDEFKPVIDKFLSGVVSEIEQILTHESHVGATNALVRYLEAIEDLYITISRIFELAQGPRTFHQLTNHVYTHVFYVTKVLQRVTGDNKVAFEVLRTEYRRLVDFVNVLSKKLRDFSSHSDQYENIFNKLTHFEVVEMENYNNVEELKIKIAVYLHNIALVLRELTWAVPVSSNPDTYAAAVVSQPTDVEAWIKPIFYEFLITVQKMYLEIRTNIIVNQRWINLQKWGFLKGITLGKAAYADDYFTNRYDEEYYGTFAKHLNKFAKKNYEEFDSGKSYQQGYGYSGANYGTEGKYGYPNTKYNYKSEESQYETPKYGYNHGNTYQSYGNTKYNSKSEGPEYYASAYETPKHGYNYESYQGYPSKYNYKSSGSEYYGKYETPKYGYNYANNYQNYANTKYNSKSEGPEYYGKNWYGSKYETPNGYSYENAYPNTKYAYKSEGPEYYGKNLYGSEYETPKYGYNYGNKYQSYANAKHSNHKSEGPEYYGQYRYGSEYQTPKGSYGSSQYETPAYFGKYSYGKGQQSPVLSYGSGYETPSYRYGAVSQFERPSYSYATPSSYKTSQYGWENQDIKTLVKNFKNFETVIDEITGEIVASNYDSVLYVRQLVQIIDGIISNLVVEAKTESEIAHIIKNLKQVKVQLQQVYGTHGDQVKYQLSGAIQQVAAELEKLTHFVKHGDDQIFKDVYAQFFSYIRDVQYQIRNVFGGNTEGYKTESSYSGKPWFYANRFSSTPYTKY